ncbi:MAG TPA: hypothetical protein ENJ77_00085 [Candidatus Moranbacteria bacterium]|nr:hypothetical protein [Candidatus Moranbacteria bacterium]
MMYNGKQSSDNQNDMSEKELPLPEESDRQPELEEIVPDKPEKSEYPPLSPDRDIDDFLRRQWEIDEQKKKPDRSDKPTYH